MKSSGRLRSLPNWLRKKVKPHNSGMPRKKQPKCIYCRGSKLTNECFEAVLISFLSGVSAEEAVSTMKARLRHRIDPVPSEKTVRRHFHLIGDFLFRKHGEPWLLSVIPRAAALKLSSPAEYEAVLDKVLFEMHSAILAGDVAFDREYSELAKTYRYLSAKKFGLKGSIRENFALASLRHNYLGAISSSDFELLKTKVKDDIDVTPTVAVMRAIHDGMGFVFVYGFFEKLKQILKETPLGEETRKGQVEPVAQP